MAAREKSNRTHIGKEVRHCGLSNHKECFDELTEACFGLIDFDPFVRAELKEHDPRMLALQGKISGPAR